MLAGTTFNTQSSTNGSTTKGFFSFSSQSILDSGKGPSFLERVRTNAMQLSINMQRYKLSHAFGNLASVIRLIQCYCVVFMPAYTDLWNETLESRIFVTILKVPTHLCFTTSPIYHVVLMIVLFAFFLYLILWGMVHVSRDMTLWSHKNSLIATMRVIYELVVPVFVCFVCSLGGYILGQPIFHGNKEPIIIVGCVFSVLTILMSAMLHFWSFYMIRGCAILQYDRLFIPWGPKVKAYVIIEAIFYMLAFGEEFFPLNELWYRVGFSIVVCILQNPVTATIMIKSPMFQDPYDTAHYATLFIVTFVATIMINVQHLSPQLTPTTMFVVCVIVFVIVFVVYRSFKTAVVNKLLKKMYSVYRGNKPVLPQVTPVVFTSPLSNQVALSQEAYQVIQALDSLEVNGPREFHRLLSAGSLMKMSAVTNIDLIKWGLNYFTDINTLIICAQVCQHFGENNQTQNVLLQKIMESKDIDVFAQQIVKTLEFDHADAISDQPLLLKNLERKASSGIARCRRSMALFWGCVLNHSASSMKEAMCTIRDAVDETDEHFDELMRCYPMRLSAIALYLTYLTEIKGEYIKCNHYINDVSARFIEMKSERLDDEESIDGMSGLIADCNRSFAPYISRLGQFMEQERHLVGPAKTPMRVLLGFTLVSLIIILISLILVIGVTLTELETFPQLLEIVRDFGKCIVTISEMTIAERRLCLFAAGKIVPGEYQTDTGNTEGILLTYPNTTLVYIIDRAERINQELQTFYKTASKNKVLASALRTTVMPMTIYGSVEPTTLSGGLEFSAFNLKQIAGNVPKFFKQDDDLAAGGGGTPGKILSADDGIPSFFDSHHHPLKTLRSVRWDPQAMRAAVPKINDFFEKLQAHVRGESVDVSNINIDEYQDTCGSEEMKNMIVNMANLSQLAVMFMWHFYDEIAVQVKKLDNILNMSMILFPIAFCGLFSLGLAYCSIYIRKEMKFRMTLYLSLPEQVASEIFRSGGGAIRRKRNIDADKGGGGETDRDGNQQSTARPEGDALKEKSMAIETLHQFASHGGGIHGSGLPVYITWTCIYIVISAVGIFGLAYYARSVNQTFDSRTMIIAYSSMRNALIDYVAILVQELFYFDSSMAALKMNFQPFLVAYVTARGFWDTCERLNEALTFGSWNITYDFREYEAVADLLLWSTTVIPTPNFTNFQPESSVSRMVHNGYQDMGLRAIIDLFMMFSRMIMDVIAGVYTTTQQIPFTVDDDTWKAYNHINFVHISGETGKLPDLYSSAVNEVIDTAFIYAVVISVATLLLLIIIFAGPILMAINAMSGFVHMTMHTIGQVQPEIFSRSMYIHKWLKGQITRFNYRTKANETYYKRTVSVELQNKVLDESPEKIILFNNQGQLVDAGLLIPPDVTEPSIEDVMNYVFDVANNKTVFEHIQKAIERFCDAKDTKENTSVLVTSLTDTPLRITVTGITDTDASLSTSSVQRYYSHVAVLIRDVTQEHMEETQYKSQKEHVIQLLSCVVPRAFALRLHSGENKFTFTSGIGSVLTAKVVDYDRKLGSLEPKALTQAVLEVRKILDSLLEEFPNLSLISMRDGVLRLVTGLFNDEQNGRTEAMDMIAFIGRFFCCVQEIMETFGMDVQLQYGVATGGPIFCKMIMDATPVFLISGEPVSTSQLMADRAGPQTVFLERTTYECIYGMNVDAQIVGDLDVGGKKVTYYSASLCSLAAHGDLCEC